MLPKEMFSKMFNASCHGGVSLAYSVAKLHIIVQKSKIIPYKKVK